MNIEYLEIEADKVCAYWARLFQPWLINRVTGAWTQRGANSALRKNNVDQIVFALQHGWTSTGIRDALREARKNQARHTHIYSILASANTEPLPTSLLDEHVTNPRFFNRDGVLISQYTLDDLLADAAGVVPSSEDSRWALSIMARDWGLDSVVTAIEIAKSEYASFRTPWGLRVFSAKAAEEIARRKRGRMMTRAQVSELTEDTVSYEPDITWDL